MYICHCPLGDYNWNKILVQMYWYCIQASIVNQYWLCSTLKFPRENIKLIICFMMDFEYCIVLDRVHFTPQFCIKDAVKWKNKWRIENSKVGRSDTLLVVVTRRLQTRTFTLFAILLGCNSSTVLFLLEWILVYVCSIEHHRKELVPVTIVYLLLGQQFIVLKIEGGMA